MIKGDLIQVLNFIEKNLEILLIFGILIFLIVAIYYLRKLLHTEQTILDEKKKDRKRDSIKEILLKILNPLIGELDRFEEILEGAKMEKFRTMDSVWEPERGTWSDFSRDHRELAGEIEKYVKLREKYRESYNSLEDLLAMEVRDRRSKGLRGVLTKIIKSEEIEKDIFDFLEENSRGIARCILMRDTVVEGYPSEIFKRWKSEFTFLRQKDKISEEMEDVKRIARDIRGFPRKLKKKLIELENNYKEEYGIYEAELEETKVKREK